MKDKPLRSETGEGSGFDEVLEYSLVNTLECDDNSLTVTPAGYQTDLSLNLKTDSTLSDVFYFVPPTERDPGRHSLRVKENISGLLCTRSDGRWKVLSFPERSAVLVLSNGEPEWKLAPDGEKPHILSSEGGSWQWFEAAECKEA